MHPFLEQILQITDDAAAIPRRYFRQSISIEHKDDATPVTVADQQTEKLIRDGLAEHFPDHSVYGEEFEQTVGNSAYQWVIDPIDGTRAFISGMPLYGMLVALLADGAPELGLIRMPELGEVYVGGPDGAFQNGTPLQVSETKDLDQAFLYINEPDKLMRDEPDVFGRLCRAGRDRRFSYDCYPHALLASGHIDVCVDYDLKPFDYMALVPVVQGAGGIITDWEGKPLTMQSDGRIVCAATRALHDAILEILA